MFGKKIGRRELLKLLPGGILMALGGLSAAMAAGDEVEAAEFKGWHLGDPCVFCGIAHDDVEIGPCHVMTVNSSKRADFRDVMKTESPARAAGDAVETIQMELGIDSAQLPQPVWDAPLETFVATGSGTIADNIDCVNYGILWDHVEGDVKTSVGFTVGGG